MPRDERPLKHGELWSRDELILAFDLYCRIPFQKTKASNPQVRELAEVLKRSPASVARKLGNFGAFDPELRKRNISGLTHVSRLDREIWEEFHNDWNELVLEAHRLRMSLEVETVEHALLKIPAGPTERVIEAKQRIHQSFFRETIMSSYEYTCCITGIKVPECLVACHIVPWSVETRLRSDPTNGLCLSATFHRLFDAGLITISSDIRVCVAGRLLKTSNKMTNKHINCFHEKPIAKPQRFCPSLEHLAWHRINVFKQ